MSAVLAAEPRILHAVPGRVRLHVPEGVAHGRGGLEDRLRRLPGVRSASVNALTGNVLVRFDPGLTNKDAILHSVRAIELTGVARPEPLARPQTTPAARHGPPTLMEGRGGRERARIPVPGLDRNPVLAQHIVKRLQQRPGVRASANPLTSRVLVEFTKHEVDLDDLLSDIADVELPPTMDTDVPEHPLDPAPLIQGAARLVGAGLGLALIAGQRLVGTTPGPASAAQAARAAGIIGLIQGFPATRGLLYRTLGRNTTELVFGGAAITTLALSGNLIGLVTNAGEAFRLLTEVIARRSAFRQYEARLADSEPPAPGDTIRLGAGERCPHRARVLEGTATGTGEDGLPVPLAPGTMLDAGTRIAGGPVLVRLTEGRAFSTQPRPAPTRTTAYERYLAAMGPVSLAAAGIAAVLTRSPDRTLAAMLLVNPRPAIVGADAAELGTSARVLRAGATVVGSARDRPLRRPDVLLVAAPRVLTDGYEVTGVLPLTDDCDPAEVLAHAAAVSTAAGAPWGNAFRPVEGVAAERGSFDGTSATALVAGVPYTVGSARNRPIPGAAHLRRRGDFPLLLRNDRDDRDLALIALRPHLAHGVDELVRVCRHARVELRLVPRGDRHAAEAVARRTSIPLLAHDDPIGEIRRRQRAGARVAVVADNAGAGPAFAACDLAIAVTSGSGHFLAHPDLLAPDLGTVAGIVAATSRRDGAARDAIGFSLAANVVGAIWGVRERPAVEGASRFVYAATLAALADGWLRLRGGERPQSVTARIAEPHPERWGQQTIPDVLRLLDTTPTGLTQEQAAQRRRTLPIPARRFPALRAVAGQLRSPLIGLLAVGAGISLFTGTLVDVALIVATIAGNAAIGAWQERQAEQAAEALHRLGAARARVLRDGESTTLPANEVVPGDIILLAPGDRVAADARLLDAQNLEVDEAALTGESLPVDKAPDAQLPMQRVVLEGSDVTAGTGVAVVVAVGRQTRMGATAAALALDETPDNPLGVRLSRIVRQVIPAAGAGGGIVVASGLLRGQSLLSQLGLGSTLALAAVPEGLPLLAGVGEAAVALRLAGRRAFVRQVSAVEALGRVDVACTDKTGTLTEGRLALTLVSDLTHDTPFPGPLSDPERGVLLSAALASPHPEAHGAAAHATDAAVIRAADEAGLGEEARAPRVAEAPFDPARSFHAAVSLGHLHVKGAVEALAPRCDWERCSEQRSPLDGAGRTALLEHAGRLAARGLRVLMVAEGPADGSPDDPRGLVALGFIGLRDPLRPNVPDTVRRCREAGVRVIMLTGDHPVTARTIAQQAGLLRPGDDVLTAAELATLENGELDARLAHAAVIARATPLDKVRIVESLQRQGHTIAMTGDGVNDAPALRLADVGVAMGHGGTDVARQASDLVLADDDFATLVEALIEGRGYWRNIRRALGLLLGGNLGEVGLVAGASLFGLTSPLTARQILAVNLLTDALPGLALTLQPPAERDLSGLAREGASALDTALRRDVLRRAAAAAVPSFLAYLLALGSGGVPQARAVAAGSIVATQLLQTLDAARGDAGISRSVVAAVGSSLALLAAAMTVPPLQTLLGLAAPTPLGWLLIAAASAAAIPLSRAIALPATLRHPALPGRADAAQRLAIAHSSGSSA